ncbi:MAG: hypothetical protein IJD81_09965 [Oscillospiraceae bacterium]|nr:hypothetical protein [Oscillospiraceae bacterium]
MKIEEVRKAYSAQLDVLRNQKQALTKLLKDNENDPGAQNFDRVEISRELAVVDAQYEATMGVMEDIMARKTAIHNAEVARQQSEVLSEAADDLAKIMEIYRRIASGGEVPQKDEQKLMEYSKELYMAAKTAAMMKQGEGEKYDSLFEDEEPADGRTKSANEIAGEAEIAVPAPEQVASAAAAEVQVE